ncbi:DHH family phosphoesterase [bacterium]|nr:DHH family phosphoesterase [bacterium]
MSEGLPDLIARLEGPGAALRASIDRASTILIASEPLPDGDAFGAMLSLRCFVEAAFGIASSREEARAGKGPKHVALLCERGTPPRYAFLDGARAARPPAGEDSEGFDLGVLVDGGVERCGAPVRAVFESCREKACIDHHRAGSRARYDLAIVDPERAATTELLATLLETEAWKDVRLSRPLAEALYTGILSDTGAFVYSLTSPWTHRIAARLLEAGARASLIGEKVMLDIAPEDLRLQSKVVLGLSTLCSGKLLLGVLTLDMLEGRAPEDVGYDRIVNPIAFVSASRATVLLREMGGEHWKVSLRSRPDLDVAEVARELDPQGGCHARAAGCTLRGPLDLVRRRVVLALSRRLGA